MTEISRFFNQNSAELTAALQSMIEAEQRNERQPLRAFSVSIRKHMMAADMLGRMRTLRVLDGAQFSAPIMDPLADVANVTFSEALADLLKREPRLASSAAKVAKVYNVDHGFALARAASLEVTKRVQAEIAKGIATGARPDLKEFARAYAQTVVRTNVATAHAAGRLQMASDPIIREKLPAFQYSAVGDSATRPSHAAMDGFIAMTDAPVWNVWAPPNGFNCRCSIRLVSIRELERRGLDLGRLRNPKPPTRLLPDVGFRSRPDAGLY